MRLKHMQTSTNLGSESAWTAKVDLEQTTLLVGRNATGKSRILASIRSLAEMITKKRSFTDASFDVVFSDNNSTVRYELLLRDSVVLKEIVTIGQNVVLKRSEDGTGNIKAEKTKEGVLLFQVPKNELAVVAKRDILQHPFLEKLHGWGKSVRYYRFNEFDRGLLKLSQDESFGSHPDPSDYQQAIGLFDLGYKNIGQKFKNAIIEDMKRIGYQVEDVKLAPIDEIKNVLPLAPRPFGLSVKERDLRGWTTQLWMSDGMFRALALIIHAAYAELASVPGAMIVDDIGEGLDYERATSLIQLLMERASRNAIQLVMSTNDRFTMNAVPLDVWCGLRRTAEGVETVNQLKYPDAFEQFKLTGLNNFDFFKTDFFEAANKHD